MPRTSSSAARATLFVIFELTLFGVVASAQQYETIHNFGTGKDGAFSGGGLVFDSHGTLYGTTTAGGINNLGTVFTMEAGGNGGWREGVIHSFGSGSDGKTPYASLVVDPFGTLYGTTVSGGAYGLGTVFELVHTRNGWVEKILHSFNSNGSDGTNPYGNLLLDTSGNLYGATSSGGASNEGIVFELKPASHGLWQFAVVLTFDGTNGANPYSGLTMDSLGNIYGTTSNGGAYHYGTVFMLQKSAGGWVQTILHSFNFDGTDGVGPIAGLTLDAATGNLYGTTYNGGSLVYGTVYELLPSSGGQWTEKILHNFDVNGVDAYATYGGVTLDRSGNLYGTSEGGGIYNAGTIYELSPQSDGSWTEAILHDFNNEQTDGYNPYATLLLDSASNLYGTAFDGGLHGNGTVFKITVGR